MNGASGCDFVTLFLTFLTTYSAPSSAFTSDFTSSSQPSLNFSPFFPTSAALMASPPALLRCEKKFQYSSGTNAAISRSRSTTSRSVTDCTRPALKLLCIFLHNTGESLYPTSLSSTRRACCASTRFLSIARGLLSACCIARLLISLNSIRTGASSGIPRILATCHEMASPSRSGSVASSTPSADSAAFLSLSAIAFLSVMIVYVGAKSCRTSTASRFCGRSRTCPPVAKTLYPLPRYFCTVSSLPKPSMTTRFTVFSFTWICNIDFSISRVSVRISSATTVPY